MAPRNPYDRDHFEEILEAASGKSLEVEFTVRVLCHSGMRAAELAHMTEDWMDWHNEQIQVPAHQDCECSDCRSKARQRAETILESGDAGDEDEAMEMALAERWRPKSEAGERAIPVSNPKTQRVMREFFKLHDSYDATRQTIWRRVSKLEDDVSFDEELKPHRLRHTFGSLVAYRLDEWDPFYIKQVMGHKDISSSQDYIHYTGQQLNEKHQGIFG